MSFLFGSRSTPAPAAAPVSPMNDGTAERQRQDAETAATADQRAHGRASTIVGGMKIAEEEQHAKGELNQKRRSAAREMFG